MSELHMAGPAWKLVAKQKILPNDVIELRQEVFSEGVKTTRDVATLLAIETACDEKCPQWDNFFISSITDYVLTGSEPYGTVTEDQVGWIKKSITRDGMTNTKNEFEVILHILDKAKAAPQSLCVLAVDQVCRKVYQDGANRRHPDQLSDNDTAILISAKRVTESVRKFSVHEYLRAERLGQLITNTWHQSAQEKRGEVVQFQALA